VRQRIGLKSDKKIIHYVQTRRVTLGVEEIGIKYIHRDMKVLQENMDEDTVVLLKSHYYTMKFFEEQGLAHLLVPSALDTNELLSVVDILITDYSSIFFEFLPTKKPVLFYAYDAKDY